MQLASHNTFSYLSVRQWWLKPIAFTARCQRVNIYDQFIYGARMFDIRVRFRRGKPIICHGIVEYDISEDKLRDILKSFDDNCPIWIRVVLETRKSDLEQETAFCFFCKHLEEDYPNIVFFGGNNRTDWECCYPIYKFRNNVPDIEHRYGSATKQSAIDDICPILYAKKNNKKNFEKGTDKTWMMVDFIDMR